MARKKAPQTTEEPDVSREPIIGLWAGHERYACPMAGCPFDTLNRAHFDDHMRAAHPEPVIDLETEGPADGATDIDQDDGAGTKPHGGDRGDDDGGEHDG